MRAAGEGGSEDPVLTGALASAWTSGLQESSDDPSRIQVAVTLKHMVANSLESTVGWSAEETAGSFTRHNISVNISNFTLSDAYFPGFRTAIKNAGARGIMCSCAYVLLGSTITQLTLRQSSVLVALLRSV